MPGCGACFAVADVARGRGIGRRVEVRADGSFKKCYEHIDDLKKIIRQKEKDLKKYACSFEKEMEERLKEEKKLAERFEKDVVRKKEEAISRHMDAKALEQKGLLEYQKGNYSLLSSFH